MSDNRCHFYTQKGFKDDSCPSLNERDKTIASLRAANAALVTERDEAAAEAEHWRGSTVDEEIYAALAAEAAGLREILRAWYADSDAQGDPEHDTFLMESTRAALRSPRSAEWAERMKGLTDLERACKSYFSHECGIDAYGTQDFCKKCAQAEPCAALARLDTQRRRRERT